MCRPTRWFRIWRREQFLIWDGGGCFDPYCITTRIIGDADVVLSSGGKMDRSLFWTQAGAVIWDDIRSFLDQQIEETAVLDYMELHAKDLDGAVQTIAAMANTDGGIILGGVSKGTTNTGKPGSPIGAETAIADLLKNKCRALLQPAFVPEIIPIPIPDTHLAIYLIRISPERCPHPVVMRERGVFVRIGDSNRQADLYTLQQLFTQPSLPAAFPPGQVEFSPTIFLPLKEHYDFMARFALSGTSASSVAFDTPMKNRVKDSLLRTPAQKWMNRYTRQVSWTWAEPMTAFLLTLLTPASGRRADELGQLIPNLAVGVRLHIGLPSAHEFGVVLLDIWLNELQGTPQWYPLALNTLYELLLTGVATITDPGLWQDLPEGFMLWSPQLFLHYEAKRSSWIKLSDIRDMTCYGSPKPADIFRGPVEWTGPERLTNLDGIVKGWLIMLLSNAGCMGHEKSIQMMQFPEFLRPGPS